MNQEQIYYNSLILYYNYPTLLYEKIINKKINNFNNYLIFLKKKDVLDIEKCNMVNNSLKILLEKRKQLLEYNNKIINYNTLHLNNYDISLLEKLLNKKRKKYLKYLNLLIDKDNLKNKNE